MLPHLQDTWNIETVFKVLSGLCHLASTCFVIKSFHRFSQTAVQNSEIILCAIMGCTASPTITPSAPHNPLFKAPVFHPLNRLQKVFRSAESYSLGQMLLCRPNGLMPGLTVNLEPLLFLCKINSQLLEELWRSETSCLVLACNKLTP
jgi:hypothetical protein